MTVHDAAGTAIFESGAVDTRGSIAGNDNDPDGLRHCEEIRMAGQVQIYESITHAISRRRRGGPSGPPGRSAGYAALLRDARVCAGV